MNGNIEELVGQVTSIRDSAARTLAIELVQEVMSLHASALERILQLAPEATERFVADELVSSVLALHGLHPADFDTRLARAIEKLQVFFDSRGAGLEIIEAGPDLIRVRFTGKRPGSAGPARQAIEEAIYQAAPEVGGLIVEGAEEKREPGFVPLESLLASS